MAAGVIGEAGTNIWDTEGLRGRKNVLHNTAKVDRCHYTRVKPHQKCAIESELYFGRHRCHDRLIGINGTTSVWEMAKDAAHGWRNNVYERFFSF